MPLGSNSKFLESNSDGPCQGEALPSPTQTFAGRVEGTGSWLLEATWLSEPTAAALRQAGEKSPYRSGVSNSFSWGGHISLAVAFRGPDVILGLYKCNYSLTVKQELGAAAG